MTGQSESGDEKPQEWIFTFGHCQPFFPGFVRIFGTFSEARDIMIGRHGIRWSMQYESEEAAQLQRWNVPDRTAQSEKLGELTKPSE